MLKYRLCLNRSICVVYIPVYNYVWMDGQIDGWTNIIFKTAYQTVMNFSISNKLVFMPQKMEKVMNHLFYFLAGYTLMRNWADK